MLDLRKVFFDNILKIAKTDKDVIVLVGDLGFSFKEEFEKELPNQIINVGICEQQMIGLAAGLAIAGKKPYCYSGSIFLLMRPYEFIRDDICYNNLNVKLIGTGASRFLGFTHNVQDNEDIKILNPLPNIIIYRPDTPQQVGEVMLKAYKTDLPVYIRL